MSFYRSLVDIFSDELFAFLFIVEYFFFFLVASNNLRIAVESIRKKNISKINNIVRLLLCYCFYVLVFSKNASFRIYLKADTELSSYILTSSFRLNYWEPYILVYSIILHFWKPCILAKSITLHYWEIKKKNIVKNFKKPFQSRKLFSCSPFPK